MLKRYLEFINEDKIEGYDTFGEWVESLSSDEYIMNIVNRYINDEQKYYGGKDINPNIDFVNSINLLSDTAKNEIKAQIQNYLESGIEEKEPSFLMSTDTSELLETVQSQTEISVAGKGVFVSFLKSLTALGQKETPPNWNLCPNDFIIFYLFENLNSDSVRQIFNRFKSLERYLHLIDYQSNEISLYFGIGLSGNFEYGIFQENRLPIGQFNLSKSVMNWILQINSKSASSLKKEIVNLNYSDLLNFGQIKSDMDSFSPGYFEKKLTPVLSDKVITFGYYGVGKWDNGKLDEGEFQNLKTNFINWLMTKRWSNKVLISLKPNSFWLYIHIKLK